ncbi:MAG: hypothetical protein WC284_11980 [Candidimonas sp.]
MSDRVRVTGRLIAAARALAGVSQENFAAAAKISTDALRRIESGGSAWIEQSSDITALMRGLDHFGVILIDEAKGMGAGVRLKFTRSDVRQIARLEDEGGMVGSDDAP